MSHELSLSAAFLLGLLGSGHCLGMCGGLMAALSINNNTHTSNRLESLNLLAGYNVGRITSYTFMGLLVGTLGWFLGGFSREFSVGLRIFSGLMLIAMGLYLAGWWLGLTRLEKIGHSLWLRIQPRALAMLTVNSPLKAMTVGFIWGWLPCGLVYSTLIWSAASANVIKSAILMCAFGLGTIPMLLLTGVSARGAQHFLQKRQVRSAAGILVMLFGLWTIPGPHQMWVMHTLSFTTH